MKQYRLPAILLAVFEIAAVGLWLIRDNLFFFCRRTGSGFQRQHGQKLYDCVSTGLLLPVIRAILMVNVSEDLK